MSKVRFVVAALLLVGLLAACSSGSDGGEDASTSMPTPPSSSGDSCTDPTGDVTGDSGPVVDAVGGAAGIDLAAAAATLDGDRVVVRFTTAGVIDEAVSPSFVVAQGNPYDPFSFEVRAVRDDATSAWKVILITWSQSEQRRPLDVPTTVAGNTLSFALARELLPPLANYLSFGATARVGGAVVFDDCSSLLPPTSAG